MRKPLAAVAAILTVALSGALAISLLTVDPAPTARADVDAEPVSSTSIPAGPASAWIIADMDSGEVLAGQNQDVHHPPASTIKTLLAQVVLDEVPLTSTIVADESDIQVECNCAGVSPGVTYTARELLDGLLLASGNDAANTLARMLGGQDAAISKMNAKAAALGAGATTVGSPSGIDGPGITMWSSAHDLAVIFRSAMRYPEFAQITAQPTALFPTKSGNKVLVNQDEMLGRYPGMLGGKTGYTDLARKTFVGAAERGGRRLVVAMMYGLVKEGGPTYWDQAGSLLDWGFAQEHGVSIGTL